MSEFLCGWTAVDKQFEKNKTNVTVYYGGVLLEAETPEQAGVFSHVKDEVSASALSGQCSG